MHGQSLRSRPTQCALHPIVILKSLTVCRSWSSAVPHELVEDLITIGRGPDNGIVINDPSVSTHHAELQRAGETYRLKDLDSTNGTRVNGIPVAETGLRFDDRIRFGAAEARYEAEMSGSQPLPQPEKITAKSAELSAAAHFTNAPPFPTRKKRRTRFALQYLSPWPFSR